ncbi:MAG: DUF6465 family protein [Lachnospiraceae bacterium]|nr:DUF6465 family protein [Lachnospiraceae bacterium]
MARKSVKAAEEEVKATVGNTEVLTEEPKKAVKKTTARKTAAKKTAEETAVEAAPAEKAEAQAEQEAASVKKTAAKKTTVRKTAAKKETKEPNVSVTFEYANKQIVAKELLAKAMEVFCAAHAEVEIQDMQLYVNADEGCAYIVVNGVEYPEDRILF